MNVNLKLNNHKIQLQRIKDLKFKQRKNDTEMLLWLQVLVQIQNVGGAIKVLVFGAVDARRRRRQRPVQQMRVIGVDLAANMVHGRSFCVATVSFTCSKYHQLKTRTLNRIALERVGMI